VLFKLYLLFLPVRTLDSGYIGRAQCFTRRDAFRKSMPATLSYCIGYLLTSVLELQRKSKSS
jgi:hypothetical protein